MERCNASGREKTREKRKNGIQWEFITLIDELIKQPIRFSFQSNLCLTICRSFSFEISINLKIWSKENVKLTCYDVSLSKSSSKFDRWSSWSSVCLCEWSVMRKSRIMHTSRVKSKEKEKEQIEKSRRDFVFLMFKTTRTRTKHNKNDEQKEKRKNRKNETSFISASDASFVFSHSLFTLILRFFTFKYKD